MTNIAKALYQFFSSFGLEAYVIGAVPDDAQLPYITYQLRKPNWNSQTSLYAEIWYRSTSMVEINAKADEIRAAIGECKSIPTIDGAIYLSGYNAEFLAMEGDDTLKRIYINLTLTAHTN